jgi:phage terminase Nu1 subunit (DNA packaging protein)
LNNADVVKVTRTQLGRILGVSADRISEYTAAGMPVLRRGGSGLTGKANTYGAIAASEWQRRHRGGGLDAQQERAALDRARRAEVELKLELRRGEVAPVATFEAVMAQHIVAARMAFLGLHARLAQEVPHLGRAGAAVADRIVREILDDLGRGCSRAVAIPTTNGNGHDANRKEVSRFTEEEES